jgi:putative restriction endonuclease
MCRLRHTPLLDAATFYRIGTSEECRKFQTDWRSAGSTTARTMWEFLEVDPDFKVHVRVDVLEEHDGPMLRHGLQELHGGRIQTPRGPSICRIGRTWWSGMLVSRRLS